VALRAGLDGCGTPRTFQQVASSYTVWAIPSAIYAYEWYTAK